MTKAKVTTQPASEVIEALRELFSWSEWKETFQHIHNDVEAVRHLSLFGYAISFALGGLISTLLLATLG